ncbi:hypothetical protein [Streptacidiphilus sp. EB103A]|uniref:hypothetical protein n=1 Tax=Streptacidiphilus sp. EB103A TaxID=3156275 RepID=UPI00351292B6
MTTKPQDTATTEALAALRNTAAILGLAVVVADPDDDQTTLPPMTLRLPDGLPHAPTAEACTAWLHARAIDASAHADPQDTTQVLVTMGSVAAVHRLTEVLLAPRARSRAGAERLAQALHPHDLDGLKVSGEQSNVLIEIRSDDLDSAVQLAALLGVPDIADGLKIGRAKGRREACVRMEMLLTGLLGPGVVVQNLPGCEHTPDGLDVWVDVEQATALAERIAAQPVLDHTGPTT